jgi:hypothetical protein
MHAPLLTEAADEIETLRQRVADMEAELDDVKQVQFPRKVEAVAAGWATKLAACEKERDELSQRVADLEASFRNLERYDTNLLDELRDEAQKAWSQLATTEKERDELRQRVAGLEHAIDDKMVVAHIGTFEKDDDPTEAVCKLMNYAQGLGEYFIKDKLAACEKERDDWKQSYNEYAKANAALHEQLAAPKCQGD